MASYIIRRVLQSLFVLLLLSFVCYSLLALMPGDPVELMISSNPKITSADVARLRELYGLDQPIYMRYLSWLKDVSLGELGYSRTYKIPVTELLGSRLINTFALSFSTLLLSLLIAVPVGVAAAIWRGSKFDYMANLLAFAGQSIPQFWLGILVILVFAVKLGLFPAGGTETLGANYTGFEYLLDRLRFMALPMMVFTTFQVATYVRYIRGAMIEVLRQDYVRTARAKGLPRMKVIWRHAFRNALIPLITVVALGLSGVFSGAIITEQIFAYQGVGKMTFDAVISNDFNVAMVCFNITVAMVLSMNLIADLCYAFVDPRISYK